VQISLPAEIGLRSIAQDHGGADHLGRVVMLATPNSGCSVNLSGWLAKNGFHSDEKLPGLADVFKNSPATKVLAKTSKVLPLRDRYFALGGWAAKKGAEAEDGLVEISSVLALDLPAGHEAYMTLVAGKPKAVFTAGNPPWTGAPGQQFGHSKIHADSLTNGVLDVIDGWLSGSSICVPKCAGKTCGPDGCNGQCGPGCAPGKQCNATAGTCNKVSDPAPTGKITAPIEGTTLSKDFEVSFTVKDNKNVEKATVMVSDGSGTQMITPISFVPNKASVSLKTSTISIKNWPAGSYRIALWASDGTNAKEVSAVLEPASRPPTARRQDRSRRPKTARR